MTTKERILDSALTLFSEKGYDGVGVDLIAEMAGIKGPAIYKHFKGKEHILNIIIENGEQYYDRHFEAEEEQNMPDSLAELAESTLKRFEFTVKDDKIGRIRRMLTIEQFRREDIAALLEKHSLSGLVIRYKDVFAHFIEQGLVKEYDPELLAFEFVTPVSVLVSVCDRDAAKTEQAAEAVRRHIEHFIGMYGAK